jgi:hypothetical protein
MQPPQESEWVSLVRMQCVCVCVHVRTHKFSEYLSAISNSRSQKHGTQQVSYWGPVYIHPHVYIYIHTHTHIYAYLYIADWHVWWLLKIMWSGNEMQHHSCWFGQGSISIFNSSWMLHYINWYYQAFLPLLHPEDAIIKLFQMSITIHQSTCSHIPADMNLHQHQVRKP